MTDLLAPIGKINRDNLEVLGIDRFDYGWRLSQLAKCVDFGHRTWKYVLDCE